MMVMQHATMLHYTYSAYLVKQKQPISQAIRHMKNLDGKFQEKIAYSHIKLKFKTLSKIVVQYEVHTGHTIS